MAFKFPERVCQDLSRLHGPESRKGIGNGMVNGFRNAFGKAFYKGLAKGSWLIQGQN
jgi:hypothetical protein